MGFSAFFSLFAAATRARRLDLLPRAVTVIDPLATFASGSFRATKITVAGHHRKGRRFDLFVFRP
jgi:hypothetical protein